MWQKFIQLKMMEWENPNVMVDSWDLVMRKSIAIDMRNLLIQFIPTDDLWIYPRGKCHCNQCKQVVNMNYKHRVYLESPTNVVCKECKSTDARPMLKIEYAFSESELRTNMQLISFEELNLFYVDDTHPINHETGRKICQVHTEHHYILNKSVEDLYHDVLARRVIRKFKKNVQKKINNRMQQILYHNTDIGIDACVVLSKEAVEKFYS